MAHADLTGKVLAQRFELLRLLASGSFGDVYEARNPLGKRMAVKVLAPEVASNIWVRSRFFREAKAAACLESAHIANVYEICVDRTLDAPFLVMELLRGESLEAAMKRIGPFDVAFAARVISQAAQGLERAHTAGVIHRDIKPANIFLTSLDAAGVLVKIIDFGVAKALSPEGDATGSPRASFTKVGTVLGTPLYMSPEQALGQKVDGRADVWSLGVCLYEALSGEVPWDAPNVVALSMKICSEEARPIREVAPWVPPALAEVVKRALAREPARRTRSMRALDDELAPFCRGSAQITRSTMAGVSDFQRTYVVRATGGADRASGEGPGAGGAVASNDRAASSSATTMPRPTRLSRPRGGAKAGGVVIYD